MTRTRQVLSFLGRVRSAWKRDQGPRLAAALAYFASLAIAPLLVLAVLIAGLVFGEAAARGEIVEQTSGAIGRRGAEAIQEILRNAGQPGRGVFALAVGLAALLLGASRAFQELQDGLNRILGIAGPGAGRGTVLKRLLSFAMVVGLALLLVLLMAGEMILDALVNVLGVASGVGLIEGANYLVSLGVTAASLSLLYRYVPVRRTRWRHVWLGAGLAAILFILARMLVSLYFERSSTASSYGAAGSFVVVLIWLYFAAEIVYLGAEIARVRADSTAGPEARPS
jgi:membrane protein